MVYLYLTNENTSRNCKLLSTIIISGHSILVSWPDFRSRSPENVFAPGTWKPYWYCITTLTALTQWTESFAILLFGTYHYSLISPYLYKAYRKRPNRIIFQFLQWLFQIRIYSTDTPVCLRLCSILLLIYLIRSHCRVFQSTFSTCRPSLYFPIQGFHYFFISNIPDISRFPKKNWKIFSCILLNTIYLENYKTVCSFYHRKYIHTLYVNIIFVS